jgi:hypothetical protein
MVLNDVTELYELIVSFVDSSPFLRLTVEQRLRNRITDKGPQNTVERKQHLHGNYNISSIPFVLAFSFSG